MILNPNLIIIEMILYFKFKHLLPFADLLEMCITNGNICAPQFLLQSLLFLTSEISAVPIESSVHFANVKFVGLNCET